MLLILVVLLVLFWGVGGFAFHVGGEFIHLLLVVALVCLLLNFLPRLRGGDG